MKITSLPFYRQTTGDGILSTTLFLCASQGQSSDLHSRGVWKTGLPVRSAVLKPHAGELVVGWVTTSESSLLYVFVHPFFFDSDY
ncbi:hypothetical protein ACN38_g13097, partial [Penicillium nordicum]